jgi:5-formyltetrahydrofolate cyclo-ligase
LHADRTGSRLGQGGGSYDRALAKSKAWKIALLHRGELTSELLPVEEHDQKIDAAATPEIIVRF